MCELRFTNYKYRC